MRSGRLSIDDPEGRDPLGPDTKKPRPCLGLLDGAKRIRTADPLHAMQVLYQLSYGPVGIEGLDLALVAGRGSWAVPFRCRKLTPQGVRPPAPPDTGCHTWRQTATSFPWMLTWSASRTIGS